MPVEFRKLINRYKRIGYNLDTQSLLMALLQSLIARWQFGPQTQWRPLSKTLTTELGIVEVFRLARRGSTIGFHLLWHTVELSGVLVFVIVINLIFMLSLYCIE